MASSLRRTIERLINNVSKYENPFYLLNNFHLLITAFTLGEYGKVRFVLKQKTSRRAGSAAQYCMQQQLVIEQFKAWGKHYLIA